MRLRDQDIWWHDIWHMMTWPYSKIKNLHLRGALWNKYFPCLAEITSRWSIFSACRLRDRWNRVKGNFWLLNNCTKTFSSKSFPSEYFDFWKFHIDYRLLQLCYHSIRLVHFWSSKKWKNYPAEKNCPVEMYKFLGSNIQRGSSDSYPTEMVNHSTGTNSTIMKLEWLLIET